MKEREDLKQEFLTKSGWGDALRNPLSSDASFRHYERLTLQGKTAMLMDAPPPKEDVEPFINIDNYLRRRGFSSPEIYSQDEKNGFLLLEDFGNDSFTAVLEGRSPLSGRYTEEELYIAAMDVLIQLDRSTLPRKMPDYDGELLLKESKLLTEWYLTNIHTDINIEQATQEYSQIWQKLCDMSKISDDVVVLRDYHADNLMWLPERVGVEMVGLLDFQDAVIGSPVYDIVSLLEDARRDVSPETVKAAINHYLDARKSINHDEFKACYAILSAQRNCKIIGIFARLAVRDGKLRYLNYLSRVWSNLEESLEHPVLKPLSDWLNKYIPNEKRKISCFKLPEENKYALV